MPLRSLLEIAHAHPPLGALVSGLSGDEPVAVYASSPVRPYLLAAVLEHPDGPADRPALIVTADDRSARDLASDLQAFVAPRRVHLYPSRGTG